MPMQMENREKLKVWFREARHLEEIRGAQLEMPKNKDDWRKIRERMKTVSVALVLCINVGVDPPDVKKPLRCARKQAWVEPNISNPQRSAQKIAQSLQKIYEKLQPRARYKSAIDPTVDCVRKLCTSMRRNAKDERVLFHYNGHGVPRPTDAGEIWVFNKNITQYIPLSLYDLQSWMGVPSVYLWDCNSAGTIVNSFLRFADDHAHRTIDEFQTMAREQQLPQTQLERGSCSNDNEAASNVSSSTHSLASHKNSIQLGACAVGETLPFHNADLPADLFTCCLTTPIQTSLLCHMLKMGVKCRFPPNIIDDIPGVLTDRKTLLGELNWIFTAITDTIAWSCLPTDSFQRLFRQDLLIASLFRSFLLAQRIMLENGCHVVSTPELPQMHGHPLWEYWDHVLDLCIANMYNLLQPKPNIVQFTRADVYRGTTLRHNLLIDLSPSAMAESEYAYSGFFIEQLQAFEIWLKFAVDKREPPQQLPVVLQVLLSQIHRVRALELLARFVDLGPWAVLSALSVGIFPYVLKLLQCGTKEQRPALAFIWAKILAIDPVCQHELVKEDGYIYFLQMLNDQLVTPRMKIVSAFVLATIICNNYRPAQDKLVASDFVSLCIELLSSPPIIQCRMLCLWILIGLGRLWSECDKARWQAIRNVAYDKAIEFLDDEVPEVRAAAVYALGCFVHNTSRNNEHATAVENEVCDKLCEKCIYDGSILVRAELAAAIQWFVIDFQSKFAAICIELDRKMSTSATMPPAQQKGGTAAISGNGTIHAGAGIELQKALAALRLSPTESGFVEGDLNTTAAGQNPASSGRNSAQGFVEVGAEGGGPKRAASGSIYSIMPRSTSLLYPARRQQRSPAPRKSSLLLRSDGASLLPNGMPFPLDMESSFKFRILSHITELERKTFIGPFERIWLCVLRLGLDPHEEVATKGECIINYVFRLAAKIRETRRKTLEYQNVPVGAVRQTQSHSISVDGPGTTPSSSGQVKQSQSNSPSVKFLVGSPLAQQAASSSSAQAAQQPEKGTSSTAEENTAGSSTTESTSAQNTKPEQQQQQLPQMDNAKRRLLMDPFIHQSLYTPKRNIFGTQSGAYSNVNNDISDVLLAEAAAVASDGLVRTSFVDWCGKTWTEPMFTTIYDDGSTSTRNSLVNSETPFTVEQPTDWAIHMHDGIRQRAKKEVELLKARQARCEQQSMKLKLARSASSIAWSLLRPYVYVCDGERVQLYSYPTGEFLLPMHHHQQHQQSQEPAATPLPSKLCCDWQVGGEYFLLDSVTHLMTANGLTHELVMTGSRNGLLKIWDPHFCEHSYEQQRKPPTLITATYLLNDLARQDRDKGNRTLYHWDQHQGKLVCSGNVRVCRIWDAWAEKAVFDIPLRHGKGSVVRVATDLDRDLVSCGFSDGTLAVFDSRLPPGECETMRLRDSGAPVVGMGFLEERQRLVVGSGDGFIRLWEPRMFREPISEFNVTKGIQMVGYSLSSEVAPHRALHQMEVQRNGQVVACAMADSSVYLFDVDGRGGMLSRMRYPTAGASSYFPSPSSAIGSLSSLFLRHARRRSSSGSSTRTAVINDGGSQSNTLPSASSTTIAHQAPGKSPLQQSPPSAPTAMQFHAYRMLLGVATGEGQFRAFSMPNVDHFAQQRSG